MLCCPHKLSKFNGGVCQLLGETEVTYNKNWALLEYFQKSNPIDQELYTTICVSAKLTVTQP